MSKNIFTFNKEKNDKTIEHKTSTTKQHPKRITNKTKTKCATENEV